MKAIQYLTFFERLFLTVMLFFTVTDVCADGYITDVAVIGLESGKGNTIKSKYRGDGWTVLDKDLNAGAHGWDIFLAYKTSSTDNPESGYRIIGQKRTFPAYFKTFIIRLPIDMNFPL